jgi:transcriptional regulator with XRE-family HTH domain
MPVADLPFVEGFVSAEFFSVRLRQLRVAAGLNQAQLADLAGIKQSAVSKLERGAGWPTWETVIALADALGVSTEAFRMDPAALPSPPAPKLGRPPKRRGDEPAN